MSNIYKIFKLIPFTISRKLISLNPLIINYHTVSDSELPHIKNLYTYRSLKGFKKDVEFILRKFHPISLQQLIYSIQSGTKLPSNSVMFTFDDGLREVYDYAAPILLENKITATLFLTKDYIDNRVLGYDHKKSLIIEKIKTLNNNLLLNEIQKILENETGFREEPKTAILRIPYSHRPLLDKIGRLLEIDFEEFLKTNQPYLTSDQIKHLIDAGFTIGGHSIDHALFPELTFEEQVNQTITSVKFIREKFSIDYQVFAFPYTDYNVSRSFFNSIAESIDLTFGTQGLLTDSIPTNLQRISVEKYSCSARQTINFHYFRKYIYSLMNKDLIKR